MAERVWVGMGNQTELQKVSEETMRFMRGRYALDELGNGKDELKFRRGGKTVLTIYIRDGRYDFLVIFGKAEREAFEAERAAFPQAIQDVYDSSKTYHDGKWMTIPVADMETLEAVKGLIMIKKKPNRKPFPKDNALYSKCGMRCDLCVHFSGGTISDAFREELKERISRVYGGGEDATYNLCPGCDSQAAGKPHPCIDGGSSCEPLKCAQSKALDTCTNCGEYPCDKALAGLPGKIEAKSVLADDVTWAILPYVHEQYGN